MKITTQLTSLALLTALSCSVASAANIEYNFETGANISPAAQNATTVYTAPDVNTFGTGITVSNFNLEDRNGVDYSRFVDLGGGSVEAAVGTANNSYYQASFTLTIDDTVTVDLSSLTFDSSFRFTGTNISVIEPDFFITVDGVQGVTQNFDWNHAHTASNPDYQSNTGIAANLAGLTSLTDTEVTFTWALGVNKNNSFANAALGLDNISLTGTVVPEPGTYALLAGCLALAAVMIRRRR